MKPNVLAYRQMARPAERDRSGYRTGRLSVDFTVDGKSLRATLDRIFRFKSDVMGCLVAGDAEGNAASRSRLLTRRKANSPEGRVLLYICPECGDVGCGAYAARVDRAGDRFRWSDFAYESATDTLVSEPPLTFVFEASAYRGVITAAATELSALRPPP